MATRQDLQTSWVGGGAWIWIIVWQGNLVCLGLVLELVCIPTLEKLFEDSSYLSEVISVARIYVDWYSNVKIL